MDLPPADDWIFWAIDSASNFALHGLVLSAVLFLAFRLFGWRRRSWVLILLAGLCLPPVVMSGAMTAPVGRCEGAAPALRVVSFNLLYDNPERARAVDWLAASGADVIVVQEALSSWQKALGALRKTHPYRTSDDSYGAVIIFSRTPLRERPRSIAGFSQRLQAIADVETQGGPVTIIGVHFAKPQSAAEGALRERQLAGLAAAVDGTRGPVVVAGDFNGSPMSYSFQQFLRLSGLSRPRLPPGTASWPAGLPVGGIQIDHVLTRAPVGFEAVSIGPELGSNHLPVIADLALRCGG